MLLLVVMLLPGSALAYTEIVDFFLDRGVDSLARGGMARLPRGEEALDFDRPLFLDSGGRARMDVSYEYQRTVRIFQGSWAKSHAYAERLETAAALPFSLAGGRVTGNVAAGYGYRWFDALAESSEDEFSLRSEENFEGKKGGIYLQAYNRLRAGISLIETDYRDQPEIPVEAEVVPVEFLRLGYRRSYIDTAARLAVQISGHSGVVPVQYGEELHELYAALNCRGILYGKFSNEVGNSANRTVEGRLNLPGPFYLAGEYRRRDMAFSQGFTVEGKDGGYAQGRIAYREFRGGVGAEPLGRWSVELNYRRSKLTSEGGGIATPAAILNFWPSLVVGNYNHLFNASFTADQYHLGAEYRGNRFLFDAGLQYIRLNTAADIHYWRSVIFGIGRADENTIRLTTDRVELLFLSLGLGYRWKNVALRYAFGQFIPLGTHSTSPSRPSRPSGEGGGGGDGDDLFTSIADKVTHNPGGNIQRIFFTFQY